MVAQPTTATAAAGWAVYYRRSRRRPWLAVGWAGTEAGADGLMADVRARVRDAGLSAATVGAWRVGPYPPAPRAEGGRQR